MGTFRMVCSKCGQVVTSPPMGGDCPKGGNHAWTQAQFNQQKIKSTPELDEKILAQLHSNVAPNQTWYKSLMLFLFPRDKRVYQYPAFQMAIASVLVIGFLNLFNTTRLKGESMAYNDVSVMEEESVLEEQDFKNETPVIIEKLNLSDDNEAELVPIEKEESMTKELVENGYLYDLDEEVSKKEVVMNDVVEPVFVESEFAEVEADAAPDYATYTVAEEEKIVSMNNEEDLDETVEIDLNNSLKPKKENREYNRKKKDKDLRSEKVMSNAPSQKVSTTSGTTAYNTSDTISPIQKVSIKNSNELLGLFFEVK